MQENRFFNKGNDCDLCKHKFMTGRDGDVEGCRRQENGLTCRFEERDMGYHNGVCRIAGTKAQERNWFDD